VGASNSIGIGIYKKESKWTFMTLSPWQKAISFKWLSKLNSMDKEMWRNTMLN
jgi:hypothetical protein